MNKSQRMQCKAVIVLFGIFFLVLLIIAGIIIGTKRRMQPEGEYIKAADVQILLDAANFPHSTYGLEYVTFGEVIDDFETMLQLQENLLKLEKKYEYEHMVLKEDWYALFDKLLLESGLDKSIYPMEIVSLGAGTQLKDAKGNPMPENVLITEDKEYTFVSSDFLQYRFQPVLAYQKEGELLTVCRQAGNDYQILNSWIMEITQEYLMFFWNGYEIKIEYSFDKAELGNNEENVTILSEKTREQVADILFENGMISSIKPKLEKVNGKILGVDNLNITVEGLGVFQISENAKVYQIYDKLVNKDINDLRIGYSFTDFVIEDGKVEACLITRDEAMENIRVLINNSNYEGKLHEVVSVTSDTDFMVRFGTYDNMQEQLFQAGDVAEFGMDSAYFMGDRITIVPQALTGKVNLLSVERNQGTPQYRGAIEIIKTAEGLVVINEVLLEEYLYCVVPSEMPASYPLEALKAQAVCARTYAYRKMMNSGLPEYGAHLDDSTSYQVYNNIKENIETTKAVRETKGELLYAPSGLVDAYYYSTSCGFGTTAEIWKSGMPTPEYLQSKRIGSVGTDESLNETTMMDESVFRSYIQNVYDSDYDSNEGWYRWNYTVEEINSEAISLRMQTRQKANKNLVLKRTNNDTYVVGEVDSFTEIYNIECKERGRGGILDSIYIDTDCGSYQVIGEYNIRYVLNDETVKVCRQDGSEVSSKTLLPSAYFVMDIVKDGECVSGYIIQGGGFGHGVGMSQNGAKNMALAGMDSTQILTFFYDESSVEKVY